jgi:hypothetical protein
MSVTDREATIEQIVDEFSLAPTEFAQQKLLMAWRAKLGKEPTSLPAFQIDKIVREVRRRRRLTSRKPTLVPRNEKAALCGQLGIEVQAVTAQERTFRI